MVEMQLLEQLVKIHKYFTIMNQNQLVYLFIIVNGMD